MTPKAKQPQWFFEALDRYLANGNLKQTQQRRLIVEKFLSLDNRHVDAEELHRVVRKDGHDVGLATIYRTLNLLVDAGLVEEKNFQDGRAVFEVREPGTHHDHVVCMACDRVLEFENLDIEALQEKVVANFGMKLVSHRLDLYATCIDPTKCPHR
jgi:Fur family ferric uptake transcriptional regulator